MCYLPAGGRVLTLSAGGLLTLAVTLTLGCQTAVSGGGAGGGTVATDTKSLDDFETPPGATVPGSSELSRLVADMLMQINEFRAENGLPPLERDSTLDYVATTYACRMATRGFFGHVDPDTGEGVIERILAAGYNYAVIAENLAAGQDSVDEVMDTWINSPAHRENLLNPDVLDVGIGFCEGPAEFGTYWVQVFGDEL